jgi:CBS domain-containing protein
MKAYELMNTPAYKVKESDTVRSVIQKFIEHRISGMPVVNDRNEVVAYISDGDIMRFIGKHKDMVVGSIFYIAVIKGDNDEFDERVRRVLDLNVMEIATQKVITVPWDEEAENIASILGKKQIKKVPVIKNGVLAGVISRGDVIREIFKSFFHA